MAQVTRRPRGRSGSGTVDRGGDGGGWRGENGWNSSGGSFPVPTPKIGLWIFLAVPTMLFAAVMSAYVVRMGLPDWQSLPKPGLLWLNTGLLIASSAAFQWAWMAARRGQEGEMRTGLLVGGALGVLFVVGQLLAWGQLVGWGYAMATTPSSSFFYLITALHGLHVVGGLVAWARTTTKAWDGAYTAEHRVGVELCATYWHFLLGIWSVLFALMLFT